MSDYLSAEIVNEILLCLPSKSLIRFTLVSKQWYSLITSKSFIRSHLHRRTTTTAAKNTSLLLRKYISEDKEERYTLYPEPDRKIDPMSYAHLLRQPSLEFHLPIKAEAGFHRLIGSCDGLVCLFEDYISYKHNIVLWNPSIHKHVTLPIPNIRPSSNHLVILGFGRDLLTNDYKVVRIVYHPSEGLLSGFHIFPEVEVYSLERRTWHRILTPNIQCNITQFAWSHTYINGKSYWIAFRNGLNCKNLILSFDIHNEVFHEILFPNILSREHAMNLAVTEYKNSLAVFEHREETFSSYCNVWVMKKDEFSVSVSDSEAWINVFKVHLVMGVGKAVGFSKNGEILMVKEGKAVGFRKKSEILMVKEDKQLVLYDPETRYFMDLGIYGLDRAFQAKKYVDSLLLLEGRYKFQVEELSESVARVCRINEVN